MPYKGGMLDMKLLARRPCDGECRTPFGLSPSIVTFGEDARLGLRFSLISRVVHGVPNGLLGQFDTGQSEVLESPFV